MQQMLLGAGAVATKTYVDDIFATTLWEGNGNNSRTITTNIDTSTDGGLIWIKNRDNATYWNVLFDSVRGGSQLSSNRSDAALAQASNVAGYVSNYSTTGFTLTGGSGSNDSGNRNSDDNVAWSFKKTPGFFDIVTWTGNGSTNRQISHSLGSIPGCIMVKNISRSNEDWVVYHTRLNNGVDPEDYLIRLNQTLGQENRDYWSDTAPTSSVFTVDSAILVNQPSDNYVAYVFAGGESTAANARSVSMSGSSGSLEVASSSDFAFGTGAFTVEFWIYLESVSNYVALFEGRPNSTNGDYFSLGLNNGKFDVYVNSSAIISISDATKPATGQWTHVAVVREGTGTDQLKLYMNGQLAGKTTNATNYGNQRCLIAGHAHSRGNFTGKVSNYRVVKGTAVYTSSFRPPTEPLTSITNTVLLCCNNSSVTGKTTGGTITATGSPTASSDSPFDDPAGFVFGDAGDQNVIKCGSYVGSGSTGHEVFLGFEPQWVMVKRTDDTGTWTMFDAMRGIPTDGNDGRLNANASDAEVTSANWLDLTPTGFKLKTAYSDANKLDSNYVYMCLRRSDGYVGKPPELGTSVFAMDTGNSSSIIPTFDSGFPVDMALYKYRVTGTADWLLQTRLRGTNYVKPNSTAAQASFQYFTWDSNAGWANEGNASSAYYSWMWKRHAGFDCIAYSGNGTAGKKIKHSLGRSPQMIWTKKRNGTEDWVVYHDGLNGGTNPANWYLTLNSGNQEGESSIYWNDTAPTSVAYTVGGSNRVNSSSGDYLSMLFASIPGISSVGSYTGTGTYNLQVTTGFEPRFILIKRRDGGAPWYLLDSLRGISSSNDMILHINLDYAQSNGGQTLIPTSTGFTIMETWPDINANGGKYLYYCHS